MNFPFFFKWSKIRWGKTLGVPRFPDSRWVISIAYYHVNIRLKKNHKKILKADLLTNILIYILPGGLSSVANVKFIMSGNSGGLRHGRNIRLRSSRFNCTLSSTDTSNRSPQPPTLSPAPHPYRYHCYSQLNIF